MSTTFGVQAPIENTIVEVAFRYTSGDNNTILQWISPLAELLPDETRVIPIDNSAQGIYTIGDIKNHIKEQI